MWVGESEVIGMAQTLALEGKTEPQQVEKSRWLGFSKIEWIVFWGTAITAFVFMASITRDGSDPLEGMVRVGLSVFTLLFS